MIIAVSMGVLENSNYAETRDTLSHDWARFLDEQGVTPLLVANNLVKPADHCERANACGILLTSGNDVGPQAGEQWVASDSVASERDVTEDALVKYALAKGIPLMGICRGMQVINVYHGGSLVRDVMESTKGEDHVAVDHRVEIIDKGYREMLGVKGFTTNSFHNQGVTLDTLASSLKPIAVSAAGVVEAIYQPKLAVWGTQWHPERPSPEPRLGAQIFLWWLERCREYSKARLSGVLG